MCGFNKKSWSREMWNKRCFGHTHKGTETDIHRGPNHRTGIWLELKHRTERRDEWIFSTFLQEKRVCYFNSAWHSTASRSRCGGTQQAKLQKLQSNSRGFLYIIIPKDKKNPYACYICMSLPHKQSHSTIHMPSVPREQKLLQFQISIQICRSLLLTFSFNWTLSHI